MNSFDHERLDAYRVAREMHREIHRLLRAAPRARQDLVDQARRSAASVVLNIAEAAGEWSPKEKAKFYRFAKRSATELAATLDLLADVTALSEPDLAPCGRCSNAYLRPAMPRHRDTRPEARGASVALTRLCPVIATLGLRREAPVSR